MPAKSLPERPSLAQLKLQAKELQRLHREKRQPAAARIIANHPRLSRRDAQTVLDTPLKLADAQLVIAREHGFESWAAMKHEVETQSRLAKFTLHPQFDNAVATLDAGNTAKLRQLLASHPELTRARTNLDPRYGYFAGATLLHHVAWNPGRDARVPPNIVDIARLLLDEGADVDAVTLGRSAGTTMGLIVTSKTASDANVSGPLIDLLLERGARLDLESSMSVIPGWGGRNILDVALSNHATRAAVKLIELGAKPDVCSGAALGADMSIRDNPFCSTPLSWAQHNKQVEVLDWMRANCAIDLHDAVGMNLREHVEARLRENPASVNERLDHWETPQSTPLYWAAWTRIQDVDGEHSWDESSRESLVRLLLDHGADPNIVAGDGYTALDVARTAGAARIAGLIEARGGKSSADL